MKKIALIVITLLMFITHVSADVCNNVQYEVLQKLANNVTTYLEPVTDENGYKKFNLVFVGLSPDIRIINKNTNATYFSTNYYHLAERKAEDLTPGETYKFDIRGMEVCYFQTFRTITVKMPKFNVYSQDPICNGAKNYSLCQKWTPTNVDYDTFVKRVNEYKSQQVQTQTVTTISSNKITFYEIYRKFYWPTLIITIIIFIILCYLWVKENKKSKL